MRVLSSATDAHGRSLSVLKLPLPPPLLFTKEEHDSLMKHQVRARVCGCKISSPLAALAGESVNASQEVALVSIDFDVRTYCTYLNPPH